MTTLRKIILVTVFLAIPKAVFAAFPQDFSDVVWIEPNISGWPVTSTLDVTVNGGTINVPHTKKDSWPISCRFSTADRVNASLWGFVKLNGVWHAGTWEYLRVGVTTRKTSTYGGSGHFRPPIGTFRPVNGEIYGFMVAGVSRDNLRCNNVAERSNVVLWRWGVGPVDFETGNPTVEEPDPTVMGPILDLLENSETPAERE
jgi:hypothetical protein